MTPYEGDKATVATTHDHSLPSQEPYDGSSLRRNENGSTEDVHNGDSSSKLAGQEQHLDWFNAPRFLNTNETRNFRLQCRKQVHTTPTNGFCENKLQCNLVVLPKEYALDFMIFCQRNPKACPLIEVVSNGSPHPDGLVANLDDADLRTDLPKYCIYRHGVLEKEVLDITTYWRDDFVSFLLGCSFSFEGALKEASIQLPDKVPMYKTNLKCRSSGIFKGNLVVSMRPIQATQVPRVVEITNKFPLAHGGPICVGSPESIGITNVSKPDWGEAMPISTNQVPVFHACGVTPQYVLQQAKEIPLCITHSPGHMFVTDLPADYNNTAM